MSITFGTALAIALAIPSLAAANTHHLVILDFEGPEAEADVARAAIVATLGRYDVVPTELWAQALRAAFADTQPAWVGASRDTGVDTVITGSVGPGNSLTVSVFGAPSGLRYNLFSVPIPDDDALLVATADGLHGDLEAAISWPDDRHSDAISIDEDEPAWPDGSTSDVPDVIRIIPADIQSVVTPRFDIASDLFVCTRTFTLVAENPALVEYPGSESSELQPTVYPLPAQPESSDGDVDTAESRE